ncbi:MAG: hypothetical protein D6719_05905 [Candidatus Dadabacteria bacterium]|nr:MAG: hypothetical protein D6719_05905 [Candidatus Dadabacteria bacterium]
MSAMPMCKGKEFTQAIVARLGLVLFLFCMLLPGCGGGTRGTGATIIEGNLRSASTEIQVGGVSVSAVARDSTGATIEVKSTKTTDDGSFAVAIESAVPVAAIELHLVSEQIDASATVEQIPLDFSKAQVSLKLESPRRAVIEETVFESDDDSPPADQVTDDGTDERPPGNDISAPPSEDQGGENGESPGGSDNTSDIPGQSKPDRRILVCNIDGSVRRLILKLKKQIEGRVDSPPEIKVMRTERSQAVRCFQVMRATRLKQCTQAVRRLNFGRLDELAPVERRFICRGMVELAWKIKQRRFVRRARLRGRWQLKSAVTSKRRTNF